MYRTPYTTDILEITFRTDTGLLIGRWMRPVSPAEMRTGYETMLAAALHYDCRHWLLDIRRRSHSDEETARWVTEEFLPQAAGQLHGTLYMSVLLSPTYLYEVNSRPTLAALPVETHRSYRIQYFTDEREANDWLAAKVEK
ncbi:hypothetical protein [Hymenobacter persicinus]|jgi:hypothetical protein|uniref:STAS/SEC14 domain-containing protein n=1 Tax=Hymenobacter persicinus TaxID=2025506 RepID=A0A4Q5LBL8_9BACT|nr:hypothetical protein [Hymenobacter persicinus]RYU79715.1 hypothetical protein EWM57_09905 [Hymenobacter persicinus]